MNVAMRVSKEAQGQRVALSLSVPRRKYRAGAVFLPFSVRNRDARRVLANFRGTTYVLPCTFCKSRCSIIADLQAGPLDSTSARDVVSRVFPLGSRNLLSFAFGDLCRSVMRALLHMAQPEEALAHSRLRPRLSAPASASRHPPTFRSARALSFSKKPRPSSARSCAPPRATAVNASSPSRRRAKRRRAPPGRSSRLAPPTCSCGDPTRRRAPSTNAWSGGAASTISSTRRSCRQSLVGRSPAWIVVLRADRRDCRLQRRARAAHRRERHRKGAGGARHPRARAAGPAAPARARRLHHASCRSCRAASSSATSAAHSPAPSPRARARSRSPNGSTLFLDEIGELPLALQAELLRVVQEHTYKRVGSNQWQRTNFRLVCATNRSLLDEEAPGPVPARPLLPDCRLHAACSRRSERGARTSCRWSSTS